MNKLKIAFFMIMFAFNFIPSVAMAETDKCFYVSVNGNDANSGTISEPFRTLDAARDAVRNYKKSKGIPEGGITVYIREGEYFLPEAFELNDEDSGEEGKKITYKAYNNEAVRIMGGKSIDTGKFTLVTDGEILSRLPVEARGKVMSLNLREQGEFELGTPTSYGTYYNAPYLPEIYVDGERQTVARWPNGEYALTGTVIDPGSKDTTPGKRPENPKGATFKFDSDRPSHWSNAEDVYLYGYWMNSYSFDVLKLQGVDTKNKTITTKTPAVFGVGEGKRYYVYNLIEELDMPGEYFIDRTKGILYYYPDGDIKDKKMVLSQNKTALIKINDANYITIEDLTVECSVGYLIQIMGGSYNDINACTLRACAGRGLYINGMYSGIRNSDIYNIGQDIGLSGGKADNEEYILCHNYITNCDIYNYGQVATTSPAVLLRTFGGEVTHNRIHDGPGQAISGGGFETKITHNEIYNVLQLVEDAGAIYNGRDSKGRKVEIAYNYIHDVCGSVDKSSSFYFGVYLDDYFAGAHVHDNIFYNVATPIFGHHGAQNIIENNLMISETIASNGAIQWSNGAAAYQYNGLFDPVQNHTGYQYYKTHLSIDWTKEPYATLYPETQKITDENCLDPFDNVIRNNVAVNHSGWNIDSVVLEKSQVYDNYETEYDIGFEDIDNYKFDIKPESEIFDILPDFRPIDMEGIGLYECEDRPFVTPSEKVKTFTLSVPKNGEENVSCEDIDFLWNLCPKMGVEEYRIILAKDEEFSDIVFDYRTKLNKKNILSLDENTKYYWKVAAVRKDKNGELEYIWNDGGTSYFTTTYYAKDNSDEEILVTDMSEVIKDADNWKKGSADNVRFVGNSIEIQAKGITSVSGYEGRVTGFNELMHFGVKIDEGTKWMGLANHAANTDTVGWVKNSHYLVIIKQDAIELHKYPDDGTKANMIMSTPYQTVFGDGTVHDIVYGTYRMGFNQYILFTIDGNVIYNIKDSYSGTMTKPGYFAIYNASGETSGSNVTVTPPVGEIPEVNFKNTDLPDEYTKLLEGAVAMLVDSPSAYVDLVKTQIDIKDSERVPVIKENRTLIPVRFATEALGVKVSWNEADRKVNISGKDKEIVMTIDSKMALVNGETKELATSPQIINNMTYLPARSLGELLDYNVIYYEGLIVLAPKGNPNISEEKEMLEKLKDIIYYEDISEREYDIMG